MLFAFRVVARDYTRTSFIGGHFTVCLLQLPNSHFLSTVETEHTNPSAGRNVPVVADDHYSEFKF